MKNKLKIILAVFIIISVILCIIFYYYFNKGENLSINDYINNNSKYIKNLETRLKSINYKTDSGDELIYKLNYIDSMYVEGLINASTGTYYLPEKKCRKKACFSVRETYLFNFNFPIYEG